MVGGLDRGIRRGGIGALLVASSLIWAASTQARTLLGPGAWCWFASPQAIRDDGQTITGYVDTSGDIVVVALRARRVEHRFDLHPGLDYDDHSAPTLWRRPDGRIVAFYSRHSGGNIMFRVTTAPGSITAWGPEHVIPDSSAGTHGDTYPNPVWVPSEHRLYVYFRGNSWGPTMTYSDDLGTTWAPAQEVIAPQTQAAGTSRDERPYARYAQHGRRTYIAFTNAHPQSRPTNVYLVFRRGSGWFNSLGQRLGPRPITPSQSDLVFHARRRGLRAWVWDVKVDSQGHPVIAFVTFRNGDWGRDSYWYASWTGTRWRAHEIVSNIGGSIDDTGTQPAYAPGIALDPDNPSIVALSRKVAGSWRLEVWRTKDGGTTWTHAAVPGTSGAIRPVFVAGDPNQRHPEILYLNGYYHTFWAFHTTVWETRLGR